MRHKLIENNGVEALCGSDSFNVGNDNVTCPDCLALLAEED